MISPVPNYGLYGEPEAERSDFWLHCETLFSRSSIHRFEIDPHRHDHFLQVLLILSGTGDAVFGARTDAILPPTVILVPTECVHGFRFSRDIQGMILTLVKTSLPPSLRTLLEQTHPKPALLNLAAIPEGVAVVETMGRIASEYAARQPGRMVLLNAYAQTLLMHLIRAARSEPDPSRPSQAMVDPRLVHLADLIEDHGSSGQPTAFYASQIGISPSHLNRLVRAGTGLTLQQMIARHRLQCAQQELVFGNGTVQAIAHHLGFQDPAYFNRFFTKATGMTPRVWRETERRKLQNPRL